MKSKGVVHFEMPTKDKQRVADFYDKAFGWKMQVMGPDFGEYVLAITTESDDNGPLKPGAINGGFFKWSEENQNPSVVIDVDNVEEAMKNIEEAGGKILSKPQNIPGIGLWAVFEDSEGNRVSIIEAPKSHE